MPLSPDDLDGDAELVELGDRRAGVFLGPVDEGEEAGEPEAVLVERGHLAEPGRLARGNGHDARAIGEQALEDRRTLCRTLDAAGEDSFGRALGDERGRAAVLPDEHRGELALVIEGERRQSPVRDQIGQQRLGGGRPEERLIEGVAAHRATSGHRRLVAEQPEQQRPRRPPARGIEGLLEGDAALGEGPGLVGEQHLDVAEVLDRDQSLDQHALAGERSRPD